MAILLKKINKSTLKLLEAESFPQLCTMVLEEAIQVTGIPAGELLLLYNDKLEKICSSKFPKKIKFNKNNKIYKILKKGKILISQNTLYIPFVYHYESIGILILFSPTEINLNKKDIDLLQLFAATIALTMKKTQLHTQVQNALEMRDRFISLASHELRTPLTSLNGYIQLLHRKLAHKNTLESRWVEELYQESTRLTNLIKELLDINRIKQGQLEFILHEVDVVEVIMKAIERFRFINKENEVIFSNKINKEQGRIIGDFDKLLQMVAALISNAGKFSKPRSKIQIILESNNRDVLLKVEDQGKGIPKKEITKIFNGFYKIGKEEKEGMGVGLLLSEHIVQHHHGKIEITSLENKGTTIEVQLPRIKI